jgi:V-type H+-transporting ATPase subunit a
MFGDIGHGSLMLAFAIFLCMNGEKLKDAGGSKEFMIIVRSRYLFLLMGFFAVYCGFIYNDMMAMPLDLFGSCYETDGDDVVLLDDCVYPFGVDPKWYVSVEELTFMNSLKMKVAVLLGVT